MSPELIKLLKNKHNIDQINLEKTNIFSIEMILL